MRSRAAAAILAGAGFTDVRSMEGGMAAWEGLVAEGPPEAGMAWFPENASARELIALAWLLEDGSRKFYAGLSREVNDKEAVELFAELAKAEENHEATLAGLYEKATGGKPGAGFPHDELRAGPEEEMMEGGVPVEKSLHWAKEQKLARVIEFCMSLETNSLDLYIKMERAVESEEAKAVFGTLSEEEKAHLARLARAFEKRI